jgi:diguanylate cyclase (GGDEF)-like protein
VEPDQSDSFVGLTIQLIATVLVAILLSVLTRSIRRSFLDYWALSCGCLALALLALLFYFLRPEHSTYLLPVYFFGEYSWAYLLLIGCRNLIGGETPSRRDLGLAPVGMVLAFLLPQLQTSFSLMFALHAATLAILFAMAAVALFHARDRRRHGAGRWVMVVALVIMTMVFVHYAPLCAYVGWTGQEAEFPHLKHSSLYDMLLEVLLAFGMVMVAMDSVRRELEQMNYDLGAASMRLQTLAQEDALTGAYNRNAFYSFVENQRTAKTSCFSGCLALIDLNDLKRINDSYGHQSGDAAIQAVARAIRSVIRADDLLFRWGGDEFLIFWPAVEEDHARQRLDTLGAKLTDVVLPGFSAPVRVGVAYGVAPIDGIDGLDAAIHGADSEMYAHKQACKHRSNSAIELAI